MQMGSAIVMLASGIVALAAASRAQVQEPVMPKPPPGATIHIENRLTSEERAQGWKLLFDGKTTNGWRGYQQKTMPDGWQVVDGALVRTGSGTDIITVDQYDSFELSLEWKISAKGNSGVMYRVSEDGEATYHTGPEIQVLDNHGHRDGKNPLTSAGACYALYAPSKDVTRPVGSWNQLRLVVKGNHVEHWLNGEKIVQYEIASPDWNKRVAGSKFKEWPQFGKNARGHIALQEHGNRVDYRNIKIRSLK
jgi:Domain of Unknown Function (DUF1080)